MTAVPGFSSTHGVALSNIQQLLSHNCTYSPQNVREFLRYNSNNVIRVYTVFYITWKPEVHVNHKGPANLAFCQQLYSWIVLVYAANINL